MNEDFLDVLKSLLDADVRFLVVGAHAMAVHGVPRATGDLDVWVNPESQNADRVWDALLAFGAPLQEIGISRDDLETPDMVVQLGLPPRRIDILTSIDGVAFDQAWKNRVQHSVGTFDAPLRQPGRSDSKQESDRASQRPGRPAPVGIGFFRRKGVRPRSDPFLDRSLTNSL